MRKLIRLVWKYIRYPNEFYAAINILLHRNRAIKEEIKFPEPKYHYKDTLDQNSTIIDVGWGYMAELSQFFINSFHLKACIVDPTQKHKPELEALVKKYVTGMICLNYAVSSKDGETEFYETLDHESGSLFTDHINIKRDAIRKYRARSITMLTLLKELKTDSVDYIKLDLEGAEYEPIDNLTSEVLKPFRQVFIEFHHHAFKRFSRRMTRKAVKHIKALGFKAFTMDTNNYLFYHI